MTDTKDSKPGSGGADDAAALANRFTELWRENLSAMAGDPAVAASMADGMAAWSRMTGMAPPQGQPDPAPNTAPQDWMNLAQSWTTFLQRAAEGPRDDNAAQSSPQPASDHNASDGRERLLHELTQRVHDLEQRLARLESNAAGPGGHAAGADAAGKPASKPKSSATSKSKSKGRKGTRKSAAKRPPAKR